MSVVFTTDNNQQLVGCSTGLDSQYSLGSILLCRVDKYDPITKGWFLSSPSNEKFFLRNPSYINNLEQGWALVMVTRETFEDKRLSISDRVTLKSQGASLEFRLVLGKNQSFEIVSYRSRCSESNDKDGDDLILDALKKQAHSICIDSKSIIAQGKFKSKLLFNLHWMVRALSLHRLDNISFIGELNDQVLDYSDRYAINRVKDNTKNNIERLTNYIAQIETALADEVILADGGSIIIESGRTLTAIDVNSKGVNIKKFNPLELNKKALAKIVQQLQLRNLGGMFVIDFMRIDFAQQYQLNSYFHQLINDNTSQIRLPFPAEQGKFNNFSRLGLYEFTRTKDSADLFKQLQRLTANNDPSKLLFPLYVELFAQQIYAFKPKQSITVSKLIYPFLITYFTQAHPNLINICIQIDTHTSDISTLLYK